eukprot:Clim_evm34s227 gene=Clim_evmTU34s227
MNEGGGKTGSGGIASLATIAYAQKQRTAAVALDMIETQKDPYFFRNRAGQIECKLCLSVHVNEASYLSHTRSKRHQRSLEKKQRRLEAQNQHRTSASQATGVGLHLKKSQIRSFKRIGKPQAEVTRLHDATTDQRGFLFQVYFPSIATEVIPQMRIVSAFEAGRQEDPKWQYVVFAAEPYQSIGFRVPAGTFMEKGSPKYIESWDNVGKRYCVQLMYIQTATDTTSSKS